MLSERLFKTEMMDDPALPQRTYEAVLADLAKVNRFTLAYRPTLLFLQRAVAGRKSFKLLDVGFGQGDMLREIAGWAKRHGIGAELVGVDLNPRSEKSARDATASDLPISYHTGDFADLAGEGWDFIISSLVAHHMTTEELVPFLRFMEAEATCGWFVNDLHRHSFSYAMYPILAFLAGWHRIVRIDGRTSIGRAFIPDEWCELLTEAQIKGGQVSRFFPFRLCVSQIR
ncbi:type 12 methyltransferase [Aurantiacibacter atlanticus]|uniref:Type 12 methyltransferase n=1 Tax=Aurantiacibacter atlanticus TaxID=1648404 RepID=A0A0H4VGG9_9SPHN|nr:methyltransferase domain-containing protein [Aurantiacibacter atlanticus]AKQ41921.1 type 12 methyltransferase [Aurantiacibacter atlanticus]